MSELNPESSMQFYGVDYFNNLYVDAIVGKKEVLFLSAWGTDTTIKEFMAKLSLPPRKGGIQSVLLKNPDNNHHYYGRYYLKNAKHLEKHTGRFPKHSILGELIHLWLYDRLTMEVDYANRRCILLRQHTETAESFEIRLWRTVMNLCPVPLLKEWNFLVEDFREQKWIKETKGIQVDATELNFSSEDVGSFISTKIHEGKLSLPKITQRSQKIFLVK